MTAALWKKTTLSGGLIIVSVFYAFSRAVGTMQQTPPVETVVPSSEQKRTAAEPVSDVSSSPVIEPMPDAGSSLPPPPAPKHIGQYADGVYTGTSADAYYGIIQVQAIVSNGILADVRFLQYPNDRNTSIRINREAMPLLKQEAIRAQSARVDVVSGATDSSQAFQESLDAALKQAKN